MKQAPFVPSTINNHAQERWEALRLRPITLHECRHTFASLLIDAGANPKALQTFMGHSHIQTTFDIYGHLLPGSREEVRLLMDEYLAQEARNAGAQTPQKLAHLAHRPDVGHSEAPPPSRTEEPLPAWASQKNANRPARKAGRESTRTRSTFEPRKAEEAETPQRAPQESAPKTASCYLAFRAAQAPRGCNQQGRRRSAFPSPWANAHRRDSSTSRAASWPQHQLQDGQSLPISRRNRRSTQVRANRLWLLSTSLGAMEPSHFLAHVTRPTCWVVFANFFYFCFFDYLTLQYEEWGKLDASWHFDSKDGCLWRRRTESGR
jgi:hypothetical protein